MIHPEDAEEAARLIVEMENVSPLVAEQLSELMGPAYAERVIAYITDRVRDVVIEHADMDLLREAHRYRMSDAGKRWTELNNEHVMPLIQTVVMDVMTGNIPELSPGEE